MRIAVLADVHGNLPALRAVLAELDADAVDAIVVAGDVVGGPQPLEALVTLSSRREPVHWIAGNCEREAVAACEGAVSTDDEPGRAAAWTAKALEGGGATRSPAGRSPRRSTVWSSATALPGGTTRS